jgi:hypothetical protein
MKLRISTPLAIALFALPACSGGGGGSSSSALPAINPTSAPTSSSTSVPLSSKRIGGAPLTATLAQLNSGRRTQSQGVTNGLPILVESSGMIAAWAGDQAVWVTSSITNADVAEASGTITPSGTLPITNPGFAPLSCLGSVSAVCITHPTGFEFGTSSANGKSVGKQTLAIAFNDGTSGTTADYVYDGWSLPCNTGFAYVSGVPVAQATQATSDVYADCANANLVFPKGGALVQGPTVDQYGLVSTAFPTVTAAVVITSPVVNVPMAGIASGTIYAITTQDGGMAKVFVQSTGPNGLLASSTGMSLHAQSDGTYGF